MADTPMRPETTSEHIARDMREGRFPEQSERQMVPVKADLPAEIMVWKSNPGLDHLGTWATERYPEEAVAYVPLETCNARVAAMVEAAATDCDRMAGEIADAVLTGLPEQARIREGMESAFTKAAARIRTLVTADHTAALDAMISRAREVKPLVWGPWEHGNAIAESILGTYCVWDGYWRPPRQQGGIPDADPYAAAQADYTARIHAALRANATDASEGER